MPKTNKLKRKHLRDIEIYLVNGVSLLEVFSAVDTIELVNIESRLHKYEIQFVSESDSVISSSGIPIPTRTIHDASGNIDWLFLFGAAGSYSEPSHGGTPDGLKGRVVAADAVFTVGSGVLHLLETDIIECSNVVAHWRYAESLKRKTSVEVDDKHIFATDGKVRTAASATACIDMILTCVAHDEGTVVAQRIARQLTLEQIRAPQYKQQSELLEHYDPKGQFDGLHAHIRENLAADLCVDALAKHCGMSSRNFVRRYTEMHGVTPANAVAEIRTKTAANLIASGGKSIQQIKRVCGFRSDETMRRSFLKWVGASPKQYGIRLSGK